MRDPHPRPSPPSPVPHLPDCTESLPICAHRGIAVSPRDAITFVTRGVQTEDRSEDASSGSGSLPPLARRISLPAVPLLSQPPASSSDDPASVGILVQASWDTSVSSSPSSSSTASSPGRDDAEHTVRCAHDDSDRRSGPSIRGLRDEVGMVPDFGSSMSRGCRIDSPAASGSLGGDCQLSGKSTHQYHSP